MSDSENTAKHHQELRDELNELEAAMRGADQFHTLNEQVEEIDRKGIDAAENYDKWDEEDKED